MKTLFLMIFLVGIQVSSYTQQAYNSDALYGFVKNTDYTIVWHDTIDYSNAVLQYRAGKAEWLSIESEISGVSAEVSFAEGMIGKKFLLRILDTVSNEVVMLSNRYESVIASSQKVGTEEEEEDFTVDDGLNIWPNPSKGEVNIKLDLDYRVDNNLVVTDLSGRIILKRTILSASDLSLKLERQGVYFLVVNTPFKSYSGKFIVN